MKRAEAIFTTSVGLILGLTALAKLVSATGQTHALGQNHPLLMLSWRWVFLMTGILELAVALLLLFSGRESLKLQSIAWLACLFVIYRLGVSWMQATMPCGCLGTLTDRLRISARTADLWMKGVLVYMVFGSVLFLALRRLVARINQKSELPCGLRNAPLVGILCLFSAYCSSSAAQTSVTAQNTVDSFKSFMQTRPVIKKVVFDRQNLVLPPASLRLPLSALQTATNVQHFEAAWQPSDFVLRRLWDLKDAGSLITATTSTAGLLISGKSGAKLWHIVNTNVYYSTQEENNDFVADFSKNARQLLAEDLDFGAVGAAPGSIKWQGDNFTARSESGVEMHGVLEVTNGLPYRLSVGYQGAGFKYVSEYAYADSEERRLPYGLPNTVYTASAQKKAPSPKSKTVFFAIECADAPLAAAYFAPDRLMGAEAGEIIATNKALYVIRNGVLVEKIRDLKDPALSKEVKQLIVILILGAVFAVPIIRLVLKQMTGNTKQRKETT